MSRITAETIAQKFDMACQAKAIGQHLASRGVTISSAPAQGPSATPPTPTTGNTNVGQLRPSVTPTMRQPEARGMSR